MEREDLACADCHMPYMREGALKIGDHHIRSPLLNINRACQTCHKWPEEELKSRAEAVQERTQKMRNEAMDALVELIGDLKAARAANANPAEVIRAQGFQRKAQFYLDFVEAKNSIGFHAPEEALRILESINFARQGQLALRPNLQAPLNNPGNEHCESGSKIELATPLCGNRNRKSYSCLANPERIWWQKPWLYVSHV